MVRLNKRSYDRFKTVSYYPKYFFWGEKRENKLLLAFWVRQNSNDIRLSQTQDVDVHFKYLNVVDVRATKVSTKVLTEDTVGVV